MLHIRPQRTKGTQEEEEEEEEGEMDETLGCQQLLKISLVCSVSNDDGRDRETQRGGKGKRELITTGRGANNTSWCNRPSPALHSSITLC